MSLSALILAMAVSATLAVLALDQHLADARNVTRLAEHFGWTRSDAADVYTRARRIGFGAAYTSLRVEHRHLGA